MKIKVVCIGKSQKGAISSDVKRFIKLLGPYCKLEVVELAEEKVSKTFSSEKVKEIEGQNILNNLEGYTIALDEAGKEMTSRKFAKVLEEKKDLGETVTFVIGGAFGLSDEVKDSVNLKLSLSQMTFTHQMVRLFLLEQIYRGFCIILGKEYHND